MQSTILMQAQQLPDNFYKTIGDNTYELEVYPKFIYYEKITEKGDRPHQKAIVNQKIDQNYLKKVLKSDKIPLKELSVSRKTTFMELLQIISETFKENPKRGRLLIEDQIISGAKLEESLEDFGISLGQVVYVEYSNSSNQWPTERVDLKIVKSDKKEDFMKTSGLYNLGNTCYMNSAIQCLANTKFFYDYFVKEMKFQKQMNLKSKYGFQGELANQFANLLEKLYTKNNVIPRNFKNCISNISEVFQGYEQQDSQEFLSFIIDGLHEELNLRSEKPYIENPDSNDRKINELGLEQWSNCLRRDWSFIYFMFYGQLKSSISCKQCQKLSITFDVFTNIPLSLPEPSKILLNITIYRLPNELKDLVKGSIRVESARSDEFRQQQSVIDQEGLYKFQESFKYITNDQPIRICLKVDKDIKIFNLMQEIIEIKDVNIDPVTETSTLVLYSSTKGQIRGIFNQEFRLTQYNLLTNEIEGVEVLTRKGRENIIQYYRNNPKYLEQNNLLSCLTEASENPYKSKKASVTNSSSTMSQSKKKSQMDVKQLDIYNLFNSHTVACDRYEEFIRDFLFPEDIFALAYHRRFVKKNNYFFSQYQPQLLANPILFILPLQPTGKRIYQEIWAIARQQIKKTSIYQEKCNLWWEINNQQVGTFKPFVIKTVDRSGYCCSQCHWMKMCSGCILYPTDEIIQDFFKKIHLAIEWHSQLIEEEYNPSANEILDHSSQIANNPENNVQLKDDDYINLEDCLRKFNEVEDLGSNDNIYCSQCRQHRDHLKKIDIFYPPPILIIQLKRFKIQGIIRTKLNTQVEFPLYNLDLQTFVSDPQFLTGTLNIDTKYNLYGMINHYGTLYFGHYTAVIKNIQSSEWFKYDDSNRSSVPEEAIQKEFAYILFYIRNDLENKQIDQIIPNIQNLFPGKPIKCELGDGFILNQENSIQNQDSYKVQIIKQPETIILKKTDIHEEQDKNEIIYDQKEIQEIEIIKKEKELEKKKLDKKQKKCRMCNMFKSEEQIQYKFCQIL